MLANTASAQTEKRATSAAHPWTVHPSPSPTEGGANKVKTRSTTDAQAQGKPPSKLGEAKKFLNKYHLLPDNAMCSAQAMSEVLQTLCHGRCILLSLIFYFECHVTVGHFT